MLLSPVVVAPASKLWRRLKGRRAPIVGVLVLYGLLACALFWPRAPWSTSTLPAGINGHGFGDPQQMVWFLAWIPYALGHGLDIFRTNFLDFPHSIDLGNTTSVPLLGLVASPITLSLGPVAAFNILLRLAFATSAASMFLVLRTWCRTLAACIGGLLYGFGPYMIVQSANHLDLIFVPLPPLIVWCVYQLLFAQEQNHWRLGLLLGALCGAQALIDPELMAMLGILIFVGYVGLLLSRPTRIRREFTVLVRTVPPALLVFIALSAYYVWSLIFASGHIVGPVYPADILQNFRSDLLEPIVPTTFQFVAPLALATTAFRFVDGNITENAGYLSVTFVVLFFYFVFRQRRNAVVVLSACLALAAYVFSLGTSLELDGHPTSVPLPATIFTRVGLFRNFVDARFSLFVALFAVIAVSIGLDRFFSDASRHRFANLRVRLTDMGLVALILATAILLFPLAPLATAELPWNSEAASALAFIPSGSAVLTYPFPISPWTESMVWQAQDEMRFRLIGGYVTDQASPSYGSDNPVLVAPRVVEQTLLQAQQGANAPTLYAPSYKQPDPTVDVRRALCAFIERNHVGAVVFWKGGHYRGVAPSKIHRLFSAALGAPTHVGAHQTLLIWITKISGCSP